MRFSSIIDGSAIQPKQILFEIVVLQIEDDSSECMGVTSPALVSFGTLQEAVYSLFVLDNSRTILRQKNGFGLPGSAVRVRFVFPFRAGFSCDGCAISSFFEQI